DPFIDEDDRKAGRVPSRWYPAQAGDPILVAAARGHLVKLGYKPADLDKLPALQIVLMDEHAQYEIELDEFMKWTNVPFWQLPSDFPKERNRESPFGNLLPMFYKVLSAKVRMQQSATLLIVAEGVRAHAATHGGKFPAALSEVKLPLPVD